LQEWCIQSIPLLNQNLIAFYESKSPPEMLKQTHLSNLQLTDSGPETKTIAEICNYAVSFLKIDK